MSTVAVKVCFVMFKFSCFASRLISAVATLALAVSLVPAAAYATDADSAGAPDVPDAAATPAPQADFPTIDVTVPVSFVLNGENGLNIRNLGDASAKSTFVNNSNVPVRIKEISCDASGLNNYFTVGDTNKASFSLTGKDISWVPSESKTTSIYSYSEDDADSYTFEVGTTETASLSLAMAGLGLKQAIVDAADDRTVLRNFMQLNWTFEMAGPGLDEEDLLRDRNVSEFTAGGVFLKIGNRNTNYTSVVSEALQPYIGRSYDLAAIQEHSEVLGSGKATSGGAVYNFYEALVTSMAPEGDYTCVAVTEDGRAYNLRIIGLKQDVAAENFGNYKEGGLVGLTFQFLNCPLTERLRAGSTSNADGWGGENARDVRDTLNIGGSFYNELAFRDNIVPVRKYYSASSERGDGSIQYTIDRMFLLSLYEVAGDNTLQLTIAYPSTYTWLFKEGVGLNHNEQYRFYQNKNIDVSDNATNPGWLVKFDVTGTLNEDGAIYNPGEETAWNSGRSWWLRSMYPGSDQGFIHPDAEGNITVTAPPFFYGVCPCFCL